VVALERLEEAIKQQSRQAFGKKHHGTSFSFALKVKRGAELMCAARKPRSSTR